MYDHIGSVVRTHLAQRISILLVDILQNTRNLPLKVQLPVLTEIQSRGVDDGQQNPIVSGFADLNAGSFDVLRASGGAANEVVNGYPLFRSCGG